MGWAPSVIAGLLATFLGGIVAAQAVGEMSTEQLRTILMIAIPVACLFMAPLAVRAWVGKAARE